MTRLKRSRTVFEGHSKMSGRVRVIDYRSERRLVIGGDILSVYPLDGDWSRVEREYWWRALALAPPRATALLIGLGGGTQVHLLEKLARPRLVTVIERDPLIVRIACQWFGLAGVGRLEFLCGEAERIVPALPHGRLVINRHRRADAAQLVDALRVHFRDVRLRLVRRGGENALICCVDPREGPAPA